MFVQVVPVFSPIAFGPDGRSLRVNSDLLAAELAEALHRAGQDASALNALQWPAGASAFAEGLFLVTKATADKYSLKSIADLKAGTLDATALYHPMLLLADPSTNDPLHSVDFFGASGGMDWAY